MVTGVAHSYRFDSRLIKIKYFFISYILYMTIVDLNFINAYQDKQEKILNRITNTITNYNNLLYWDIDFKNANKSCMAIINIKSITETIKNDTYKLSIGIVYKNNIIQESTPISCNNTNTKLITTSINNTKAGINFFYVKVEAGTSNNQFMLTINDIQLDGNNEFIEQPTTKAVITSRIAPPVYHHTLFNMPTASFLYKEFNIPKHRQNMWTTLSFPTGYGGFSLSTQKISFSVWDATFSDTIKIATEVVQINKNVNVTRYDHEGSGVTCNMAVELKENQTFGLAVHSHTMDFTSTDMHPTDKVTYISFFFINLGPITQPFPEPAWLYIATLKAYKHQSFIGSDNKIHAHGFFEHYAHTDGLLYTRSVIVGNGWASVNGEDWVASECETFTAPEDRVVNGVTLNCSASIFNQPSCMLKLNTGGRNNGKNNQIVKRSQLPHKPYHLTKLITTYPFLTQLSNITSIAATKEYSSYIMHGPWIEIDIPVLTSNIMQRKDGGTAYVVIQDNLIKIAISYTNTKNIKCYHQPITNNNLANKLNGYHIYNYNTDDVFDIDNLTEFTQEDDNVYLIKTLSPTTTSTPQTTQSTQVTTTSTPQTTQYTQVTTTSTPQTT